MRKKLLKLCATRFEMSTSDYVDKLLALIREELPKVDIEANDIHLNGQRAYRNAVLDLLK